MPLFKKKCEDRKNIINGMTTSNSIFRGIVTIFNNCQGHCQFKIMNFSIEQRISIIKWYYPAREGRSGKTAAVKAALHQDNNWQHYYKIKNVAENMLPIVALV
jgi:hypothetical protein